jgi:hypothetical protein
MPGSVSCQVLNGLKCTEIYLIQGNTKMEKENLQNYCAGKDLAALLGLLLEDSQ